MLGEPARTPYDLRFSIMGFDVRISPWFWLAGVLLGGRLGGQELILWTAVILLSILIHELGHALAFRHYGISSHIVLYHFGGLAVPDSYGSSYGGSRPLTAQQHMVVSASGPALQILAAIAMIIVLRVGNYAIPFALPSQFQGQNILPSASAYFFVAQFLYVSIFWALLNLLPVYPLDGGQIARDAFLMFGSDQAMQYSLMLSVAVGGAVAFWGFTGGRQYLGFMFAMLAYSNFNTLSQYGGGIGGGGGFGRRW
jgi:Zn-dependent protease